MRTLVARVPVGDSLGARWLGPTARCSCEEGRIGELRLFRENEPLAAIAGDEVLVLHLPDELDPGELVHVGAVALWTEEAAKRRAQGGLFPWPQVDGEDMSIPVISGHVAATAIRGQDTAELIREGEEIIERKLEDLPKEVIG